VSISMYQASVPRFVSVLTNLANILDKAQAHVDANKLNPEALTTARLFPDMFEMARQVQIATDAAKGVIEKLSEVDAPAFEDNEKTLAELKERVVKTVNYLQSVPAEKLNGSGDKQIVTKRGTKETHYTGTEYLLDHGFPNFYFHVTTCYNILRHNGLQIGAEPRNASTVCSALSSAPSIRPGLNTEVSATANRIRPSPTAVRT